MRASQEEFIPNWSNFEYWFPEEFIPLLSRAWGFYHSLPKDSYVRLLLTIPLLKVSRRFSYNDAGRMKLSRSPRSIERIRALVQSDWKGTFYALLERETATVIKRLEESHRMFHHRPGATVRAGVDTLSESLTQDHNVLITSPPYLQSQEYIRYAKMDLYWLGHSESEIKRLSRLEVPYRSVERTEVHSTSFERVRERLSEDRILRVYDNYFHAIIGCLERLQDRITDGMFIFVGRSSLRGDQVPIDRIIAEHFVQEGWVHERTLVDKIVARNVFSYGTNPATGTRDSRTTTEHLVILKRS